MLISSKSQTKLFAKIEDIDGISTPNLSSQNASSNPFFFTTTITKTSNSLVNNLDLKQKMDPTLTPTTLQVYIN